MTYLIECPNCESVMGCEVKAQCLEPEADTTGPPKRVSLCICPRCSSPIVGTEEDDWEGGFERPQRVWPSPPMKLSSKIPKTIRGSLFEAQLCLKGAAYSASVAMCGRALEAVGRHFYPAKRDVGKPLMLKNAIDKLAADGIIDGRLHRWGLALHIDRNLAAHPSGTQFDERDARDIFKFATNICEYIFVLSADFEEFEKRRQHRKKDKPGEEPSSPRW